MTVTKGKKRDLRAEIARVKIEIEEAKTMRLRAGATVLHLFGVLGKLEEEAKNANTVDDVT